MTVLSGDIDGNDWNTDTNYIAETWYDIQGNNAYHVMWLDGVTNEPITETTVIDGFTITAGQANGSDPHDNGGGLYCDGNGSGNKCSPSLAHVTFIGSQASTNGGGMYNYGELGGDSNPILVNVTFNSNQATYGGGIFNNGTFGGASSPTLTNVTFKGNQVTDSGGGMYNGGGFSGNSSPVLTNVTFSGNQANTRGGGMRNDGWDGDSQPVLTNITFNGNQAGNDGGGLYNHSKTTLTNCILWGNGDSGGADETAQIFNDATSIVTVTYSIVQAQKTYTGTHNSNRNPRFATPITYTATPTTAGDLRLRPTSPAIDDGDNSAITLTTDLAGNARFVDMPAVPDVGNGTAPLVDMGAYEYMTATLSSTLTVDNDLTNASILTYTVVITNPSDYAALDTLVYAPLPTGTTFITGSGWASDGIITPCIDGTLSAWSVLSYTLTQGSTGHAAVRVGEALFALGGGDWWIGASSREFDRVERTVIPQSGPPGPWVNQANPMDQARHMIAAVNTDSYVYAFGGAYTDGSGSLYLYGSNTRAPIQNGDTLGTWSTIGGLNHVRYRHAATRHGDYVYVLGGVVYEGYNLTVERATVQPDGSLSAWSDESNQLVYDRWNPAAVTVGDYIYLIAGWRTGDQSVNNVERAPVNTNGTLGS